MAEKNSSQIFNFRVREKFKKWLKMVFMIALAIFFLFPIVFMLMSSIKGMNFKSSPI